MWRCELLLVAFFSVVLASLTSGRVFAEGEMTISISPETAVIDLMPGTFRQESQTITISTNDTTGYLVSLRTTGSSSALINVANDSYMIPTFTLPTDSESIPVDELDYGYGYSIDSGENYLPVPEPSSEPVILFKTTAATSTNEHSLTFGVKAPVNTVAGTYTNTFVIEVVANLILCDPGHICYSGNGDDGTGVMKNQEAESNDSVTLMASNFSRDNYGFAGWNTEADGSGTDYGPSQAITTGDLSAEGIQLYANWIPSAGTMQGWHGCAAMDPGDVTALTDSRDGSTYAIAKQADNKCWMIENLRLDLSEEDLIISASNTNNPSSDFVALANQHPASSNSFCTANTNPNCIDRLLYNTNNINRDLDPAHDTNDASSSWYSYGVYYNYYTATTGYGGSNFNTSNVPVSGDLCPLGWRLPTAYGASGDFATLDRALGGSGKDQPDSIAGSERWRNYPLNYIYSGEQNGENAYNRDNSGGFNSANVSSNSSRSVNFWIRKTGVSPASNTTLKIRGQTIRCVMREGYNIVGIIHYNSNGGTGTMADEENVNFSTAIAATNEFTKTLAEFVNWNTRADGTGTIIPENSPVERAANDLGLSEGDTLTLYATWRSIYSFVYDGNNAGAGDMTSITHENVTESVDLVASNYSRQGFGFAGWSPDIDAGTKLLNHQTVKVYGPNQNAKIETALTDYADANNVITMYAVWLPADTTDTLQSFSSSRCTSMNTGDVLALTDERDNDVYAVSKLADGHCWMIENLRLDPSNTTFTATNTNAPTESFVTKAGASSDSKTLCNTTNSTCIDSVTFNANNLNSSLTASPSADNNSSSWYSYGMMYGWFTATAGNGTYAMTSGNVIGDICPANWRLPTGGSNSEFVALVNSMAGTTLPATNAKMLSFPNNFIYSGDYNHNTAGGRGTYGRFWSATPFNANRAYRLGVAASGPTPEGSWEKWDAFAVRCILK